MGSKRKQIFDELKKSALFLCSFRQTLLLWTKKYLHHSYSYSICCLTSYRLYPIILLICLKYYKILQTGKMIEKQNEYHQDQTDEHMDSTPHATAVPETDTYHHVLSEFSHLAQFPPGKDPHMGTCY